MKLASFLMTRIVRVVLALVVVTFVVYTVTLGTRDPVSAMLGEYADPQLKAALTDQLGLNKPLVVQYWNWLTSALQGDLGSSVRNHESVTHLIGQRIVPTVELAVTAAVIAVVLGVLLGGIAARLGGTKTDYLLGTVSLVGLAIPAFFLGLLLILIFGVWLKVLPTSGYAALSDGVGGYLRHMILPAVTLSLEMLAVVFRLARGEMIANLREPFVLAARARGISEKGVMTRYVARTALIPVMTFVGLRVGFLFGGAIVVETVFSIPGLGSLTAQAVYQADFPVILGCVLLIGVVVAISNILVDLLYRVVDPRVATY